jgi:hypothetical protein
VETDRLKPGHLLAGAGALIALGSLWMPWFRIDLGAMKSDPSFANGMSQVPQMFRGFVDQLFAVLPGSITGNGWQTMERTDIAIALAAVAVLVVLVSVASLGADGRSGARLTALISFVALGLVAIKYTDPGPLPKEFVEVQTGLWVAGAGWAAALVGSLLAGFGSEDAAPSHAVPVAPEPAWIPPDPSGSVAPPK